MAVLYRKYRPQTFAEVLNQRHIIQTLKNQVAAGQPAHAYLFTGSRGVGKTSVARILAKAVNCLSQKDGEACGECADCKAVAAGNFLDLVEIDAASNTGVDNIRELIEHVKFAPSQGKYKVFIIDEVHMLSKGAFNALLKTLEEPPRHAIFILATTEINKVPATIVSRTQRFDFKALSPADIFNQLEKVAKQENLEFPKGVLELVAQTAEGSVRDALSLLDKLSTLGSDASLEEAEVLLGITDIAVCQSLLELISLGAAAQLPAFLDKLLEKGLDFKILNRDFLEYCRKALIYKITSSAEAVGLSPQHQEKLEQASDNLTVQDLMFIIRLFLRSFKELDSAPSPQIPLLLAALEASLRKSENAQPAVVQPSTKNIREQVKPEAAVKSEAPVTPAVEARYDYQPSPEDNAGSAVSLAEARVLWPKVINKIKEINGPLSSLLRGASLQDVQGSRLVMGVKFLFDKKNLENPKNAQLISQVLEQVCGKKMGLTAQVVKAQSTEVTDSGGVLADALKVFGGELLE